MRKFTKLLLGAAIVFSAAPRIAAQSRNSITGIAFDTSRRPIPNLRIELLDEVESRISTTQTDGAGRYSFQGLSDGNFLIRPVTVNTRFVSQTFRVQLFPAGGRGSHHEQLDLILKSSEETRESGSMNPGVIFAQKAPEEAQKAFERGVDLLDRGKDADSGMAALEEAVKIFPDYYLALERLGMEYVKRERYEPARETLLKAVEVNPKGHVSLYALGVAQFRLKQYSPASESLRKMILLASNSPNAPFANYHLGLSLVRAGKAADAEAPLKKAYEAGGKKVPADDLEPRAERLGTDVRRHTQRGGKVRALGKALHIFRRQVGLELAGSGVYGGDIAGADCNRFLDLAGLQVEVNRGGDPETDCNVFSDSSAESIGANRDFVTSGRDLDHPVVTN